MSGLPDTPLPFTGGRIAASEEERALASRRVLRQFILAPAVSFALLLIGFKFDAPRLAVAGVIGFGLNALWIGFCAVREKRLIFIRGGTMTRREYRYFFYEGAAAIPYGLTYLVGGVCLIIPSLFFLGGRSLEQMRTAALTRPSIALIPVGLMFLCYGLGFLVGFVHRGGSWWQRGFGMLLDAPARLGGVILIAWAAAMLIIGVVEWLNPSLFRQWFEAVVGVPFWSGG